MARRRLPGRIPGALAAVLLGVLVYYLGDYLAGVFAWPIVPPPAHHAAALWRAPDLLPGFSWSLLWWQRVALQALADLPVMLPFALATIVGGIDCTESAAAAGDEYDTRTILLTEGLASMAAGACGGVIQNTPYIGHPAYKAMGGRAAYTLATAMFIGAAGIFGWFTHLFEWLPEAAAFPILVFIGLEISAQSFRATPERHFPALALAILPALAYLVLIATGRGLAGRSARRPGGRRRAIAPMPGQRLHCDQPALGVGPGCACWTESWRVRPAISELPGFAACSASSTHRCGRRPSPCRNTFWAQMSQEPAIRCQSPYHWAAAYALAAVLLILLHLVHNQPGFVNTSGKDDVT